jgi:hypothetical protein
VKVNVCRIARKRSIKEGEKESGDGHARLFQRIRAVASSIGFGGKTT